LWASAGQAGADETKGEDMNNLQSNPCICKLTGPYADDNARLIAAAPELLEACRDLLKYLWTESEAMPAGENARNAVSAAFAAVDKAERTQCINHGSD
jgi:hypothetical protein